MNKKITACILSSLVSVLMLCSCGGTSDADVKELFSAAQNSGAVFEELVDVENSEISYLFNIEEEWFSDYSAAVSGNLAYADEIAVFKASSSENAVNIKESLEKRVESRKKVLESYAPDEFKKLQNAEVIVKGKYVYLVVGKDNKTAENAIKKLL